MILSLFAISGEVAARAYLGLRQTKQRKLVNPLILDDKLGWRPTPNYVFYGNKTDAAGKRYPVKIKTNNDGFRIFGDPQEKIKKKVLFLGDSFTHALEVSNDKTFYGLLKDALSIEVFAFGGGGYGTLQEYLILEKYVEEIRPDVVVVQLCSNDFINNSYDLELRSKGNNNGMRRPYFTENGIIYRTPKYFAAIREVVNKYSRFFYFIVSRIDRIMALRSTSSAEHIIRKNGGSYPLFEESIEITEHLLKKIKSCVPSTTLVYAFSVNDPKPYYDEFKRISEKSNIGFIDGIPQAVREAERKGVTTRAADKSHWNETGHQIAANVLKNFFEANW